MYCNGRTSSTPARLRIGWFEHDGFARAKPACVRAVREARAALEASGPHVLTLHYITLQYCIEASGPHVLTLHYSTLQYCIEASGPHVLTLHYSTLHYCIEASGPHAGVESDVASFRYITLLHCIVLHRIVFTLHGLTLHDIALHDMP